MRILWFKLGFKTMQCMSWFPNEVLVFLSPLQNNWIRPSTDNPQQRGVTACAGNTNFISIALSLWHSSCFNFSLVVCNLDLYTVKLV